MRKELREALAEVVKNSETAMIYTPPPIDTNIFYPNPAHNAVQALYRDLRPSKHSSTRKQKPRKKVKHGNRKKK